MVFEILYEFPGFILDLLTLTESNFHHLLGLLTVIVLLRLFVPLHLILTMELLKRNEVADLAEESRCNEFDIFVQAHDFYYGSVAHDKVKQDFITYLNNWPENYILPFYLRNYLAELKRDNTDSQSETPDSLSSNVSDKLSDSTLI